MKLSVKVLAKLTQILTELVQILIEPRGGELTFGEPKFFRSFNSDPRLQFPLRPRSNEAGGFFVSPRAPPTP